MATLKGIFPDPKPPRRKNFIQENVKNLRRMEQCFHSNKDIEELQKLQSHRQSRTGDKYQNVTAKVNTSFRDKRREDTPGDAVVNDRKENEQQVQRKTSAPTLDKKCSAPVKKPLRHISNNNSSVKQKKHDRDRAGKAQQDLQTKVSSDPNLSHKQTEGREKEEREDVRSSPKYRSQGIQTLDDKDIDTLYEEGVIRYPSKKSMKHNGMAKKIASNYQENGSPTEESNPPSDRGDMCISEGNRKESDSPHEEVDFVKLNKERTSVASKLATQLNNGVPPPNYRKGVVPKYIRDRKEAQEKEQKAKAAASHPDCPPGHVPLPDHERKETLRMLKKNYQDYVNELNMMPIRTDTLRSRRRKIEIEKQLNKLEEGIKVFSRPIVYVKVNT